MADKRVRKTGIGRFGKIYWNNDKTIGKTTYTITLPIPITRCHCDTHHRFCCLKSTGALDERPVDSHTSVKRESQDSQGLKRKIGKVRSRSNRRRRRVKATIRGSCKTRR